MASIHKKRAGWIVRWREAGANRTSATFPTKADAAAWLRALDQRLAAVAPHDGVRPIPWGELVIRWDAAHPGRSPIYRADSMATLSRLAEAQGWATAAAVLPTAVQGLPVYQARILRALLRWAQGIGQQVDPRTIAAIKPKAPRRQPQHLLSPERVAELVAEADKWHLADGTIAHLVATYGHRVESLIGLDWQDLDLAAGTVRLRVKSGDTIAHPLLPETVERFAALRGNNRGTGTALVGHLGAPWSSGRAYASWWRHSISRVAGAGILDLRRHAITGMLDGGADAKTVASITGHRTPSLLLNVYARTTEARQFAALSARARSPFVPPRGSP